MSSHQYFQFQTNTTKFFQPLLSHNCNVFSDYEKLDSIIPTHLLFNRFLRLSNLLTIQAVFLALALAAPTMLAEPLVPVPPNTATTMVKSALACHPGHTDKFSSIATTIQQSSSSSNSINHINCTNQKINFLKSK